MIEPIIKPVEEKREDVRKALVKSIKDSFPIESNKFKLELDNAHHVARDISLNDEKDAILTKKSILEPIKGDLTLTNKETGEIVDKVKDVTLANSPRLSQRYGFILAGNEYNLKNQQRLRSGIYARTRANDELETSFNLKKGANFRLSMTPETGNFYMELGNNKIPLQPILKQLGLKDEDIKKSWGEELYKVNQDQFESKGGASIDKLYSKLVPDYKKKEGESLEDKVGKIKEYYNNTELDKEITKSTLNKEFDRVTPEALLAASKSLLDTFKGEKEEDDRDSLEYQKIYAIEDHLSNRIELDRKKIQNKLKSKLDNKGESPKIKEIYNSSLFTEPVKNFITTAELSTLPSQINPVEIFERNATITKMGEGGIGSERAIPFSSRSTHHSQVGFIDPYATPESEKAGIDVRLSQLAAKDEQGVPHVPLLDAKTGKLEYVPVVALKNKVIAFANQEMTKGNVDALKHGEVVKAKPSEIDYIHPHINMQYSLSTNSMPFMDGAQGNRIIMSSKMQSQAVPLVTRENPLVTSESMFGKKYKSMDEEIANYILPKSPENGEVTNIDADFIYIVDKAKKIHKVPYERDFPLASKTYIDTELKIKKGDIVKKGQILGDNNFTKDGKLALGKNLDVAYLSYYGKNSNDGMIVSETGAKKLTSMHMYKKNSFVDDQTVINKNKYITNYPQKYINSQLKGLDSDGVVKPGTILKKGDPIILTMKEKVPSMDDIMFGKLHKSLSKKYADNSVEWDKDDEGEVIDVKKTKDGVVATVKTFSPLKVGDKITNRYGGKGVVSEIISDEKMIKDAKGNALDLLVTQSGVLSRVNPAQIHETVLGKVAHKTGKPYTIQNFKQVDNNKYVEEEMAKHGVKDTEDVFDPVSGKTIPNIMVGKSYIYKLSKSTDTNFSARNIGGYDSNQQPTTGGKEGAKALGQMEINALFAHNARNILKEASTIRSQKNDEFWRAVQLGLPIPNVKSSFVMDKFTGMLKGSGINVQRKDNNFTMIPLTDNDVDKIENVVDNGKMLHAKDLKPEKGGLFDEFVTGGVSGEKWSKIKLQEPVVNPVFEGSVKRLLGVTTKDLVNLQKEKGGEYIRGLLKDINVDKKLKELEEGLKTVSKSKLDDHLKQIKSLRALKKNNLTPDKAYVLSSLPVLPPIMRPITPSVKGDLLINDSNYLYRDVLLANEALGKTILNSDKKKIRGHLNSATSALFGLSAPVSPQLQGKRVKGFIENIAGDSPKYGFYQHNLIRKRQDVSGRGTAVPDINLELDQVGIPEDMAWTMFKPFIIGSMVKNGVPAVDAKKQVEDRTVLAKDHLSREISNRPVIINRAPSLHKFNLVGAYGKVVPGQTLRVNPLIERGLGLDYDGDSQISYVVFNILDNSNKYLDINENECHIKLLEEVNFRNEFQGVTTVMASRIKEVLGYNIEGNFYICNLEDFPHAEKISEKYTNDVLIEFYKVPKGVRVLAYDEVDKKIKLANVEYWSKHSNVKIEIVSLASKRQIITDDDERAVYGLTSNLEIVRRRPSESIGIFVPKIKKIGQFSDDNNQFIDIVNRWEDPKLYTVINLSLEFGRLCGSLVANAWVVSHNAELTGQVCISSSNDAALNAYKQDLLAVFKEEPHMWMNARDKAEGMGFGDSFKHSIANLNFARFVESLIGKGARNKHLPYFFLFAPKEFKIGLLSGLLNFDGSIAISHGKKRPQWMINYSTTSIRLAQELTLLTKSLGVIASLYEGKTPKKDPCWIVTLSSVELHKLGSLAITHSEKKEKFLKFFNDKDAVDYGSSSYGRTDVIPISTDIAIIVATRVTCKNNSLYIIFRDASKNNYITRTAVKRALKDFPDLRNHPDLQEWLKIVDNEDITWDRVVSYEKTGIKETGYDLTVPGYETFANIEGVILSNTLQIHAPVTDKGISDIKNKMLTSKLLFSDKQPGELNVVPTQDSLIGYYKATTGKNSDVVHKFKTIGEATLAYEQGKVSSNDLVEIEND